VVHAHSGSSAASMYPCQKSADPSCHATHPGNDCRWESVPGQVQALIIEMGRNQVSKGLFKVSMGSSPEYLLGQIPFDAAGPCQVRAFPRCRVVGQFSVGQSILGCNRQLEGVGVNIRHVVFG
jgi:hypothetical protein